MIVLLPSRCSSVQFSCLISASGSDSRADVIYTDRKAELVKRSDCIDQHEGRSCSINTSVSSKCADECCVSVSKIKNQSVRMRQ